MSIAFGQSHFDSLQLEKAMMTLPHNSNGKKVNSDIVKAIDVVNRNYRKIVDTLFYFKSLKHTIFQTVFIETDDSIYINPLDLGDEIHLTNIIFENSSMNVKLANEMTHLNKMEREKAYKYLSDQFDNFSADTKKLNAQPVRIVSIKFPNDQYAYVGMDIYGDHFQWTIDKRNYWKVIKVERLWVY